MGTDMPLHPSCPLGEREGQGVVVTDKGCWLDRSELCTMMSHAELLPEMHLNAPCLYYHDTR